MDVRKWISLVVILAFVATTMPSISHATISNDAGTTAVKSVQKDAPPHEGCHGHGGKKQNSQKVEDDTADEENTSGKPCCNGKICKCIGNSCNGSVKVFGSLNLGFTSPCAAKAMFSFEETIALSDFYSRIKRPPRS